MNYYDIWLEGYLTQGMEGIPAPAQRVAYHVEAKSFVDAVKKWYYSIPDAKDNYGKLNIKGDKVFIWRCEAFPDEENARKKFG